jgi:hypothetical protein
LKPGRFCGCVAPGTVNNFTLPGQARGRLTFSHTLSTVNVYHLVNQYAFDFPHICITTGLPFGCIQFGTLTALASVSKGLSGKNRQALLI